MPGTTDFDITTGTTSDAVRTVLDAKYADAGAWASYAAGLLEGKLQSIADAADAFDISGFIDAAKAAIDSIPTIDPGTVVYTPPDAPSYDTVPGYTAPDKPTYDTVAYTAPGSLSLDAISYTAPDVPSYDTVAYSAPASPTYADVALNTVAAPVFGGVAYAAPTAGTLLTVPTPSTWTAGTAPSAAITFDNPDFSDSLLTSLKTKLTADLATPSTGLGAAESDLFARETARQNAARALSYTEITTQFSARGFDMPPGALQAKQTEMNNESSIRLSDSSSQIMAESARLAQSWNATAVTASAQLMDLLSRVFDSKIMRNFEAAKQSVLVALEGFKAKLAEVQTNAQLEGIYIGATGSYNDVTTRKYTAEIGGETAALNAAVDMNKALVSQYATESQAELARLNAVVEGNRALISQYVAESQGVLTELSGTIEGNKAKTANYGAQVQAAVAQLSAIADKNKALVSQYSAEVQGAIAEVSALGDANKVKVSQYGAEVQVALAPITATAESNRSKAQAYSSAVQGASASASAQGEAARAIATAGEINSRKALGIADISTKFALTEMDVATRKYLGEIQLLQGAAQSAAQLVAAALNGVHVSATLGYSGSGTSSSTSSTRTSIEYPQPVGTPPPRTA